MTIILYNLPYKIPLSSRRTPSLTLSNHNLY